MIIILQLTVIIEYLTSVALLKCLTVLLEYFDLSDVVGDVTQKQFWRGSAPLFESCGGSSPHLPPPVKITIQSNTLTFKLS